MEEFNQEYFEYKISINIFEQAIVYLSIKLFQFFIIINKNLNIRLCFKWMLKMDIFKYLGYNIDISMFRRL